MGSSAGSARILQVPRGRREGGADVAIFRYIVIDVNQAVTFYTSSFDFRLEQSFAPTMAILRREDLELWTAGPEAAASKAISEICFPIGVL